MKRVLISTVVSRWIEVPADTDPDYCFKGSGYQPRLRITKTDGTTLGLIDK